MAPEALRWTGRRRHLDLARAGQRAIVRGALREEFLRRDVLRAAWWRRSITTQLASVGLEPVMPPTASCLSANQIYAYVPTASLVNIVGFGLGPGEWHPYVAGVQELLAGNEHSPSLHAYYDRHVPTDLAQVFALPDEGGGSQLRNIPAVPYLAARVFSLTPAPALGARLAPLAGQPNQFFGPRRGDNPGMKRAMKVYESVRAGGYRPFDHHQGAVRGYVLAEANRFRFVVTDGNHRLAALKLLEVPATLVHVDWTGPPVIFRSDLAVDADRRRLAPGERLHVFDTLFNARGPAAVPGWGTTQP